jgi:hypothetical protein
MNLRVIQGLVCLLIALWGAAMIVVGIIKHLTLEIRPEQSASPFPDTIDLQEALLEAA